MMWPLYSHKRLDKVNGSQLGVVCDSLENFSNTFFFVFAKHKKCIGTHFLFSYLEFFIYYLNNSCFCTQFDCSARSSWPVLLKVWLWTSSISTTQDLITKAVVQPCLRPTETETLGQGPTSCIFISNLGNSAQWLTSTNFDFSL